MEISAEKTASDDKQGQRHPEEDQGKRAEAGYSNKLRIPWSSCLRWWLYTGGSLKNCISHLTSYKVETDFDR